ncbi:hypothetical protein Pla86_50150 [Planctomycetes bacterium Pla86]|uniref:Uncharacterized protein n=1 Tax=Engelhardtia mirabilis TaxID=2528011 RepID=A0A518BSF0_9BACT|nr:hypothetical protein Pla133_50170 [Planctomycetes bacterium Pla133]QDV04220.1 hypothetical protein Pla86_50150 [Planctomycetes bacterium Pla86]
MAFGELLLVPADGKPLFLHVPPDNTANPVRFDGVAAGEYTFSFDSHMNDLRLPPAGELPRPITVHPTSGAAITIVAPRLGSLLVSATTGSDGARFGGAFTGHYTEEWNVVSTDEGLSFKDMRVVIDYEPPYRVEGLSPGRYLLKPQRGTLSGDIFVPFEIVAGETTTLELALK